MLIIDALAYSLCVLIIHFWRRFPELALLFLWALCPCFATSVALAPAAELDA